jgi:hypothetical protein
VADNPFVTKKRDLVAGLRILADFLERQNTDAFVIEGINCFY